MMHFKLEMRMLIKSRSTQVAFLLIILLYIFAFYSTYNTACSIEQDIKKVIAQIHNQVQQSDSVIDTSQSKTYLNEVLIGLHPKMGPNYTLLILALIGPLLSAIIGASIIGVEFSNHTAKNRAAHFGWTKNILAKLLVLILCGIGFALLSVLIGIIFSKFTWGLISRDSYFSTIMHAPVIISSDLIKMFVVIIGFTIYGFLGALVGLLAKNTLAGALTAIFLPYLEKYLSIWWLPQSLYANLIARSFNYFQGSIILIPQMQNNISLIKSWIILSIWCISLLVSALIISRLQSN